MLGIRGGTVAFAFFALACSGSGGGQPAGDVFSIFIVKSGLGLVVSDPEGLDCGVSCRSSSIAFQRGTVVTLTATPDAASNATFLGWAGVCTGAAATCSFTLDGDKSVEARFSGASSSHDAGVPVTTTDGGRPPITITVESPAADTVVTGTSLDVVARIQAGSPGLDPTRLEALIAPGAPVQLRPDLSAPNRYRATLPIGTLTSGRKVLTVRARTLDGMSGSMDTFVLINQGPVILVSHPSTNDPAATGLSYDFTVGVSRDLGGLRVASVSARVGQCTLTLARPTTVMGDQRYAGATTLSECSGGAAEGRQDLVITATDDTPGGGVTSQATAPFVLDRTGPTITMISPVVGQLVGRNLLIQADIVDAQSTVNPSTVRARISASQQGDLALVATGNRWSGQVDLYGILGSSYQSVQSIVVEVVATDALGNPSTSGGALFNVDAVPPIAAIDPPPIVVHETSVTPTRCSLPLDPLGADVAADGSTVAQAFDLRALIMDMGNLVAGADRIYIAKVKTARVYILEDTTQPLVVDTDGDGYCDSINDHVKPVEGQSDRTKAVRVELGRVNAAGSYHSSAPWCSSPGSTDPTPPAHICSTTPLTWVPIDFSLGNEPLMWTIPPVIPNNDFGCVGQQYDASAHADGWLCLAVETADNVGNVSVSAPVRYCLNKAGGTCPVTGSLPNCTGHLNRTTGQVNASPCTPRRFGDVIDLVRQH